MVPVFRWPQNCTTLDQQSKSQPYPTSLPLHMGCIGKNSSNIFSQKSTFQSLRPHVMYNCATEAQPKHHIEFAVSLLSTSTQVRYLFSQTQNSSQNFNPRLVKSNIEAFLHNPRRRNPKKDNPNPRQTETKNQVVLITQSQLIVMLHPAVTSLRVKLCICVKRRLGSSGEVNWITFEQETDNTVCLQLGDGIVRKDKKLIHSWIYYDKHFYLYIKWHTEIMQPQPILNLSYP